jgi:hypothetical protein
MGLVRDASFFDAFNNHVTLSVAASRLLLKMLDNLSDAASFAKQIKDLEHQGDKITHECVATLHQTWITPLDREYIHALITRLDDVLDLIEAASERILLFEIAEPTEESRKLGEALVSSCLAIQDAVSSLRDLKKKGKRLLELCIEINKQENKADQIYRTALSRLFKHEKDPMLVMKWRDVYDQLENATDVCEDVANIIEGVVLEHA